MPVLHFLSSLQVSQSDVVIHWMPVLHFLSSLKFPRAMLVSTGFQFCTSCHPSDVGIHWIPVLHFLSSLKFPRAMLVSTGCQFCTSCHPLSFPERCCYPLDASSALLFIPYVSQSKVVIHRMPVLHFLSSLKFPRAMLSTVCQFCTSCHPLSSLEQCWYPLDASSALLVIP
ncbi:hypothetical protein BgiBS90_017435 [Biomphalaria glabrata]|nr:hypothetical protein BgiBS90_017435 [Biomphalaria glabrata]